MARSARNACNPIFGIRTVHRTECGGVCGEERRDVEYMLSSSRPRISVHQNSPDRHEKGVYHDAPRCSPN
ncbi:hypothetical protein KQX54_021675 [Cotesia glomerata]|uniref:Uncharacterized protein n=1 Tax=Cotesia glomerata TaxID=32391 RepID=A0AAV7J922_COTGL|nr:hypothetical protein KQX54_021675 [Cotesia glomerata]